MKGMSSAAGQIAHLPPRIGLTSYRNRASWGVWNESADLLPANYAESVGLAGGAPVLLPAPAASATRSVDDLARAVLAGLDGLVLTGGPDVDPARYGAEKDPNTQRPKTERDEWEIALVRLAVEIDLPTFCICRGMQTLNVALGGSLIQHLPDLLGHEDHSPTPGVHGRHVVRTAPDTRIASIIGEQAEVATYHHQAVDGLAEGLVPTAWSDDGTIEAAEHADASWLLAVQWHPEVFNGDELFADFVAAASAHSNAKV
jgi:putative glutamine amidotransferase